MELEGKGWLPTAETDIKEARITNYYQLCHFADIDGYYTIRRFRFRNPGAYIEIKRFKLTKNQYTNLKSKLPLRFYKEFSTYDLDDVPYPSNGECLMALISYSDNDYVNKTPAPKIFYPKFTIYYT